MNESMTCPVCGSEDIESIQDSQFLKLPFGEPFPYFLVKNTCRDCGSDGDFLNQNTSKYAEAEKAAIKIEIENILNYLRENEISNAYIERALGLPQRTVARWKAGKWSFSSIALLRMIRSFPWLIKVADAGYSISTAAIYMAEHTVRIIAAIPNIRIVHKNEGSRTPGALETCVPFVPTFFINLNNANVFSGSNSVVHIYNATRGLTNQ